MIATAIIIIAIFVIWYFSPKIFLRGINAANVKSISVFDGNTGKSFSINNPDEIHYIVENIQSIKMERGNISINYSGYSFRISFYGEDERVIDSFIINSVNTIRSDPFFYRCDDGLCFDYLKELEAKYAK